MMAIPFEREFDAPYERTVQVSPLIRRLLARNPSPFTFKGTGVAIIGKGEVAVIDPGPDDPEHLAALRAALSREITDATVVIVAQRVSTIRDADRIVVLDEGRVVGTGNHTELMNDNETYREIVLSQLTEQEAAA